MRSTLSIILVGTDPQHRAAIRQQLGGSGRLQIVAESGDMARAMELIEEHHPQAALLMMNGQPEACVRLISEISAGRPELAVICTGTDTPSDQVVRAFRAGAREFLSQPISLPEISEVIERIEAMERVPPGDGHGVVIACYGARGGSGCTTVAVNLATALARSSQQQVVILDLNLQSGTVPIFLGCEPAYTIADVAHNQDRLDAQLLKSFLTKSKGEIYCLAAPIKVEEADDVHPGHIERMLPMLTGQFGYVVVDCPHTLDSNSVPALDSASAILTITMLDMPSIYATKRMLSVLQKMGYEENKLKLIVNRFTKSGSISLSKVEEALGSKVMATLAEDARAVADAMNLGTPLEQLYPKSPVLKGYAELARQLASGPPPEPDKREKHRFSLFGRRKS